jgi:hypothetical protein
LSKLMRRISFGDFVQSEGLASVWSVVELTMDNWELWGRCDWHVEKVRFKCLGSAEK